jgi:hypothetical protein
MFFFALKWKQLNLKRPCVNGTVCFEVLTTRLENGNSQYETIQRVYKISTGT